MPTPNSTIVVLKGVPLTNSYTNTLYFESQSDQYTHFSTASQYTRYTFNNQMYQRVGDGKLRIQASADTLWNANYMYFQNTGYSAKWFYAFINHVAYVNENCCEVTYEIDVMQTWLFHTRLGYCMVEREHSVTDEIGDNTQSEPMDAGDLVFHSQAAPFSFSDYSLLIFCASTTAPTTAFPQGIYNGDVYNGLAVAGGPINSQANAISLYQMMANLVQTHGDDAIKQLVMVPSAFISIDPSSPWQLINDPITVYYSINRPTTLGASYEAQYTPRNNKLFTYPYCFANVDTGDESQNYKFELTLLQNQVYMGFSAIIQPGFTIYGFPYNYNGITGRDIIDSVKCGSFGQCCNKTDAYASWASTNSVTYPLSLATTAAAGLASSVATSNPMPAMAAAASIVNMVEQKVNATTKNAKTRGGGTDLTETGMRLNKITCNVLTVKAENAKVLDNFFDHYGYACNRLKVPNRSSRPEWNYVKLSSVEFENNGMASQVPQDDLTKIRTAYLSGITFWNNPAHVGRYELSNAPVSTTGREEIKEDAENAETQKPSETE